VSRFGAMIIDRRNRKAMSVLKQDKIAVESSVGHSYRRCAFLLLRI
jgi:hypothetical protein